MSRVRYILVLLLLLPWTALAQSFLQTGCSTDTCVRLSASWQPPTNGSPVVYYTLHIFTRESGRWEFFGDTEDTTLSGFFPSGVMARVRGTDAQARSGPWSETSDEVVFPRQVLKSSFVLQIRNK